MESHGKESSETPDFVSTICWHAVGKESPLGLEPDLYCLK